jgi:hypothetical protein
LRFRSTGRRRSMSYFADLQPFAIRTRNKEVLKEVGKQRLEKRLRDYRRSRSGRAYVLIFERLMPLPR